MLPAIVLFAATYIAMLLFGKYRPYIALASGAVFILAGMLPVDALLQTLDFNVLLMIAGTMGLVALFIESKMPSLLAYLFRKEKCLCPKQSSGHRLPTMFPQGFFWGRSFC